MEHYETIRQKYNIQEKQQIDYFDMLYDSWILSQPVGENILLEPILVEVI
jgi:hypothetical protein